jgi:hypothetical protein
MVLLIANYVFITVEKCENLRFSERAEKHKLIGRIISSLLTSKNRDK